MKSCPKCQLQYFDEKLDFCLEDGSRLIAGDEKNDEIPTIVHENATSRTAKKTVNLPFTYQNQSINSSDSKHIDSQKDSPLTKSNSREISLSSNRLLEVAPLVISLAHNWWQWIYLNNQYYSTFWSYVFSANFLMWLLLLGGGAAVSFYSLKKSQNNNYAIIGFVILSINLLLFLVPKR